MALRRLTVLSGSDPAAHAEHVAAATRLGALLAENAITLVYDGGTRGAVAALAEAVREAEGRAVTAPPEELAELGDAVVALPGGPATLAELFAIALPERGDGSKPCGLLNTADYYSELLKTGDDGVIERFVRETQRGCLVVERDPATLLRALADFRPPETRRHSA